MDVVAILLLFLGFNAGCITVIMAAMPARSAVEKTVMVALPPLGVLIGAAFAPDRAVMIIIVAFVGFSLTLAYELGLRRNTAISHTRPPLSAAAADRRYRTIAHLRLADYSIQGYRWPLLGYSAAAILGLILVGLVLPTRLPPNTISPALQWWLSTVFILISAGAIAIAYIGPIVVGLLIRWFISTITDDEYEAAQQRHTTPTD